MALGWIYLYSKYRKAKRNLAELEAEYEDHDMICDYCGYALRQHSDDEDRACPSYD